jgi:predicted tellurium resistance membrane protein TerC
MVAAMLIALALLLVAYFLFRAALEELRPESYPPAPGGT